MNEHQIALEDLYVHLVSSPQGLRSTDARARLTQYGRNILEVRKSTPESLKFLKQFNNFFALLLIVGGALAFVAEYLAPRQGSFFIGCALYAVAIINASFIYLQERHAEQIMESFRRMLSPHIAVLRDGHEQRIDAKELVPGDIMALYEGDKIPADARLIAHNQLKVDMSSLTGESEPKLRHLECTHHNILESRNMIFSGSLVQSGDGKALVFATGMQTQFGRIVQLTKETEEIDTPIRREIKHFTRVISIIAVSMGLAFFIAGFAIGRGWLGSLIFAIGIIVANVPEGLLPTVTLALAMASKRMAQRNALVKHLESVETLGSTTVICTDKTGTLTQNRMSVHTLILNQREYGAWDRRIRSEPNLDVAWAIMSLCNNAQLRAHDFSGDPMEGALLVYADRLHSLQELRAYRREHEQPFDSLTKRMITVHQLPEGAGYRAYLKGAPEVVFSMCSQSLSGERLALFTTAQRRRVAEAYERLARRGERVLALAYRDSDAGMVPTAGYIFAGLVGLLDPPRDEVPEAIRKCRTAGIRVIMITGDYGLTAEAIGRQIGLIGERGKIVRGDELATLNDRQLDSLLDTQELIFARTSPLQKLRIVKALQARGDIVTVTGDGVNDAPALKNADMGVAMGQMGTEVAKESAKMVLLDDNFATIVAAVEQGRNIFINTRKFIAYHLTSNTPEMLACIAYFLLDIPLPLTVVLILFIDLGTDLLPAIGLGVEPPESDIMKNSPRPRTERLLTRNLLLSSYGVNGLTQAAAGFSCYVVVLVAGGWQWGQVLGAENPLYRSAITAFFAAIVICQIVNVMICRTRTQSLRRLQWFGNRWILLGITTEVLLLAILAYFPPANAFFGTGPLIWWQVLPALPAAMMILAVDELRRRLLQQGHPVATRWLSW
jgi:sodium/potassium-transporting ATPase subunit alpha